MPTAAWVALVVILLIAIGGYLYYAKKNKKWPF
ncbi:MAG TPA: LPXTG cell wall anchor domain-containing protein [Symbiobacteriaceae bacterium]